MKRAFSLLLVVFLTLSGIAQEIIVSGKIVSLENQTPLAGATVSVATVENPEQIMASSVTDLKGNYSLQLKTEGLYRFEIRYVGYENFVQEIDLTETLQLNFELKEQLMDIGEVVVTSLRQEFRVKEVPVPVSVVRGNIVEKQSAFSISDMVQDEPGITLARDGIWSTSVNIRGLSEQRIVTLVDGNRIETATDLTAGLAMFAPSEIDRIEVIKGAASSIYGTGAMGGVVNIITRQPGFSDELVFHGRIGGGFHSVNELFTRNMSFQVSAPEWYARLSGSLRDANDTDTPEGTLENSQFSDNNITLSLGYKPLENHTVKFNFQRFHAKDVGIPGGAPFPGPSKATYPDEARELYSISYVVDDISESLRQIEARYYHQYILRDVELIPNTPPTELPGQRITAQRITPTGRHYTNGAQVNTQWSLGERHELTAGIDLWERKLETEREKYIQIEVLDTDGSVLATNQLIKGESPIPSSRFGSAGVYFQDKIEMFEDKLDVIVGGRYDYIRISNEELLDPEYLIMNGSLNPTPPNQRVVFEEATNYNQSWSVNMGLLYSLVPDMDLHLNLARSFRSPSLEERFKYIDLGSSVRLGDPGLKPEEGVYTDLGFRVWKPHFQFKASIFGNFMENLIVEEPGEFIYTIAGTDPEVQDTLPALINANVDKARLYGAEVQFSYNPFSYWVLDGSVAYVRGEDTKDNENLPLMPPFNASASISYKILGWARMGVRGRFFADQENLAPGETGTAGYARYDFFAQSVDIPVSALNVKVMAGVENIFDRAYRNFLATNRGMVNYEPGRNIYVKLNLLF